MVCHGLVSIRCCWLARAAYRAVQPNALLGRVVDRADGWSQGARYGGEPRVRALPFPGLRRGGLKIGKVCFGQISGIRHTHQSGHLSDLDRIDPASVGQAVGFCQTVDAGVDPIRDRDVGHLA